MNGNRSGHEEGEQDSDSGRSYWATADGFCECPDAERVARCKHALAVLIAVQLAAVARSKATQDDDARATFARLTREHQEHGRELIAAGTRPIDDRTYRQRDDEIQVLRRRLPAADPRGGRGAPPRHPASGM
jgi:hypothetical protein